MAFPKRSALPKPNSTENLTPRRGENVREMLDSMVAEYERAAQRADELQMAIEQVAVESICGGTDESEHVELYDGTLGVSRDQVLMTEAPVGQLQWLNFAGLFSGPTDDAGNLSGVRWGTGTLVSPDIFLTAGHLFDQYGGGWIRPKRNGEPLAPEKLATLMGVV